VVDEGGQQDPYSYATKEEAEQVKRSLEKKLCSDTISLSDALELYREYQLEKGNKEGSVTTTGYRLRSFFTNQDELVVRISPARGQRLYDDLCKRTKVDTHRNTLAEAKTFMNWCVRKKWIRRNPLTEIEGKGKRNEGKEQLRINEARKWIAAAFEEVEAGNRTALAALCALYLGLRASEILLRIARDVDDDGRILWIPDGKTKKAKRLLEIPEPLQAPLRKLVEEKQPRERLFDGDKDTLLKCVKRICRKAKVPQVCTHSMRGLHSTLAADMGVTGRVIAEALGHASFATTKKHYAKGDALQRAGQRRVRGVLSPKTKKSRGNSLVGLRSHGPKAASSEA